MKKNIKYLLMTVIVFTFALILLNTNSYAGSQSLDKLSYEVTLNEDGSADVTEIWDIYVYSTNTLFKTFEKDSSKYGEITNVTVQEISTSGEITNFIETDEYAYHVEKGYFYALDTSSTEFEIAWGVSIDYSANKTYKISYTITDAVKTYNDCSEFYWQFIGDTNGIPADDVVGTIKLPSSVSNTENLKVWAHGPLNGEIYAVDNETLSFEVEYLSTNTMVEVRVVTTENIFVNNTNIVNSSKLNSIIEEETEWAEEANEEREKLIKEQEMEELLAKIMAVVIIIVGIVIVIIFCMKIIKYIKILRDVDKVEPEEKIQYYREIPDKSATPSGAALLYYFNKKNAFKNNLSNILSASILDLALTKAITFVQNEKDDICITINKKIEIEKIKTSERRIFELLKKIEKYTNDKSKKECGISMKDIEKFAKRYDNEFLSTVEGLEQKAIDEQSLKNNYDNFAIKDAEIWKKKKYKFYIAIFFSIVFASLLIPIFLTIPLIICAILCNMIYKKKRNLTQQGANEKEKWEALKRYMEDFSMIDDRVVPELALWEEYLVYATAFGIADKVLKQLKIKYPQINDETYMINSGYAYIHIMNRYNFDRMLTRTLQKSYDAGMRERAARESASSGSFSSGRRRRRWLLRRRRTAEEAGGRNGRKIKTPYHKTNQFLK